MGGLRREERVWVNHLGWCDGEWVSAGSDHLSTSRCHRSHVASSLCPASALARSVPRRVAVIPVTHKFDHVTPVSKTLRWLLFLLSTKGKVSQVAQTPQGPAPRFLPSSRKPPHSPCSTLSSHIGPSLLSEHAPDAPAQGLFPLLFLLLGMFLP